MKLAELMDTIVGDVTQHCLRITHEQHQLLNSFHWSVVVAVVVVVVFVVVVEHTTFRI